MAIILLPHQPIDFTYRENEPCEILSDMCLQYEVGDNPRFQVKRDSNSVPFVTITGIGETEFKETAIDVISQDNNYFTYELNFEQLGIISGCYQLCVYEAKGATLVTNGSFLNDLSGWAVLDGLSLTIAETVYPDDCDGEVELSASGGASPYEYSVDGVNYQSSETFTGLCVNTQYSFYVRDSNNVVRSLNFQFRDCSDYMDSYLNDLNNVYLFEVGDCYLNDFE